MKNDTEGRAPRAAGFSMIELLLTVTVMAIIAGFAVFNIIRTRENTRLINAAHELQGYIEKARADAMRRHGTARIRVLNAASYEVGLDLNGDGLTDANNDNNFDAADLRVVTLPPGVNFITNPMPAAAQFDWRGRIAGDITFTLQGVDNQGGARNWMPPISLAVAGGGDITINSAAQNNLPTFAATPFPPPPPTPAPPATTVTAGN
ncbi:MAG TPA: GspH/FimT family pseudopilin [Pyrinomonadaceae bacterium]|jgi:type IV fimbrial biogenesis protein FimT